MTIGAAIGVNTVPQRVMPGFEYTAVGTYTLAAAIAQNDTITFTGLLPRGAQVQSVTYSSVELDTNATPTATVSVGTAATAGAYIAGVSVGLAAAGANQVIAKSNVVAGLGLASETTAVTDVVVTYPAAFATAASAGVITVEVRYYCNRA